MGLGNSSIFSNTMMGFCWTWRELDVPQHLAGGKWGRETEIFPNTWLERSVEGRKRYLLTLGWGYMGSGDYFQTLGWVYHQCVKIKSGNISDNILE